MPTTRTYAAGDSGQILRRDNHTGSWVDITPPALYRSNWLDVMADPTNPDKVVVVGVCGSNTGILVSTDAGVTWNLPVGDWQTDVIQYEEVWFVNANTIWAVGLDGYVVRSVNGGLSFNKTARIPDPTVNIHSKAIHAWDNYVAVVAAAEDDYNVRVFKTIDGGITWTTLNGGNVLPIASGAPLLEPVGLPEGIWISQDQTKIIVTTVYTQNVSSDSGNTFVANAPEFYRSGQHLTWYPSHVNSPGYFRHVGGVSFNVAVSTDLGSSFTIVRDISSGTLTIRGAHFYSSNSGYYIVEDDIYTTSDGAVTGTINHVGGMAPGSNLNAVWTQAPVPDCNCTRFRWDKPSCCLDLTTTGNITVSLNKICAQSTENGKVSFTFTSGSDSFKIAWSNVNQRWELIWINAGNLVLAYLSDNILCPFGEWTITTNHKFITSLTTVVSDKLGVGLDCDDNSVQIHVPFDINNQNNAGNWTDNLCLKAWSITNSLGLVIESETSGLCNEVEGEFICRSWYKLVDCQNDSNSVCVANDLSDYYNDDLIIKVSAFPDTCWRIVQTEECTNNAYQITITASFENCIDCLPVQPEVGVACELTPRLGEPGFSTRYCDPEELIKIKCTFAGSVYALFKRLRYGIETCCEYDLDKADIKNMLVDLGELYDPEMCAPVLVPVTCCPQPCNVQVQINVPVFIGCPAPVNAVATIDVPVPCLRPVGPVTTNLTLCADCQLFIPAGQNQPPTIYTNCFGEEVAINHPTSKTNSYYSICIDPTQPVTTIGVLTIMGSC